MENRARVFESNWSHGHIYVLYVVLTFVGRILVKGRSSHARLPNSYQGIPCIMNNGTELRTYSVKNKSRKVITHTHFVLIIIFHNTPTLNVLLHTIILARETGFALNNSPSVGYISYWHGIMLILLGDLNAEIKMTIKPFILYLIH